MAHTRIQFCITLATTVFVVLFFGMTKPGQRIGYLSILGRDHLIAKGMPPCSSVLHHVPLSYLIIAGLTLTLIVFFFDRRISFLGSSLLTQGVYISACVALKNLIPHPEHGVFPHWNTMPSGHFAVFLSLFIPLLLTEKRNWKNSFVRACLVSAGMIYGWAILASTAHQPTDLTASVLILMLFTGGRSAPGVRRKNGSPHWLVLTAYSLLACTVVIAFTPIKEPVILLMMTGATWLLFFLSTVFPHRRCTADRT